MFTTADNLIGVPIVRENLPMKLTSYQAKQILKDRGLHAAVVAIVYDPGTPERVRTAWEEGLDWERYNPMVLMIADLLPLNSAQLDELFISGAAISAYAL